MDARVSDFATKYAPFQRRYSERTFWARLKKRAKRLGERGLQHALTLYYTLHEPGTPAWAKSVIIGALGYLIFPLDSIPDFIPIVGMTDDLTVLAAAIAALELSIPQTARDKAAQKMAQWFGQ